MLKLALALALFSVADAAQVYTLCASGCTYSNAQTAINAAVSHQGSTCEPVIIRAAAGETFTGNFSLPAKSCAQWIYIDSSALRELPGDTRVTPSDTAKLATFATSNSTAVFTAPSGAQYYVLRGLEVRQGATLVFPLIAWGSASERQLANAAHHLLIDRVYGHGPSDAQGPVRILQINGPNVIVRNSDFRAKYNSNDAQAVWCSQACNNVLIENNRLEASGEVTMIGGAGGDGNSSNNLPQHANMFWLVRANLQTKDPSWKRATGTGAPSAACLVGSLYRDTATDDWYRCTVASGTYESTSAPALVSAPSTKNINELKDGRAQRFIGNISRNTWNSAQTGNILLLNQTAQTHRSFDIMDVEYAYGKGEWLSAGLASGQLGSVGAGTRRATSRIHFHDNLYTDYYYPGAGGAGRLNAPHVISDLVVQHITGATAPGAYITNNADVAGVWHGNFAFINNAINGGGWIAGGAQGGSGYCGLRNAIMASGGAFDFRAHARVGSTTIGACSPSTSITGPNLQTGTQPATAADLWVDPDSGDFRIKDGSPAKNAGTDGRDIGADIDMIDGAIAGVEAGVGPSIWHRFQIRGVLPTSDGAVIQWTAPTAAACTWTASTAETFSDSVGSFEQTRAGLSATATVSGLDPASFYFARVECGNWHYDMRFITAPGSPEPPE